MAEAITMRGNQILVKVSNGLDPEVFAHPCLINTSRGISFTTQNNQVIVPDCDNPSDPAWTRTIKESMTATVSGAGTLHLPNLEDYFNWVKSSDPKNCQIVVGIASQTLGGYFSGAFQLTEFELQGEGNSLAEATISLSSDGAVTWTAHA